MSNCIKNRNLKRNGTNITTDSMKSCSNSHLLEFGKTRLLHLLLLSALILASLNLFGQHDDLTQIQEGNRAYKEEVYRQIKTFVENNPRFHRNDEQYMKLAELSTSLFPNEPELILGYYKKVFELNPHFHDIDVVLYNIGHYSTVTERTDRLARRAQYMINLFEQDLDFTGYPAEYRLTEERLSEAINAYSKILSDHSRSVKYSEALFRLAAIYYDIGHDAAEQQPWFERANNLFSILADREDDRFRHIGLYQRAWTNYSKVQYEDAIRDFAELLNVVDEEDEDRLRVYYEEDAINNIAYSLDRLDVDEGRYLEEAISAQFVWEDLNQLIDKEDYIKRIIARTAEVKLEAGVPLHAVDYYNSFLTIYPTHIDNPIVVDSIATIYRIYQSLLPPDMVLRDLVAQQKEKLVNDFHAESEWYLANADKPMDRQVEVIREAFHWLDYDIRNAFVQTMEYEYLSAFEDFVEKYATNPNLRDSTDIVWVKNREKDIVNGYATIANNLDNLEFNYRAWKRYIHFNERYPHHDEFIDFSSFRYYSFYRFYEIILETEPVDTLYVIEELEKSFTLDELQNIFLTEADIYLTIFTSEDYYSPDHDGIIITALWDRSQIYRERDEQLLAEKDLLAILDYEPDDNTKYAVYLNLAEINDALNNFDSAERFYRTAAQFTDDDASIQELVTRAQLQIREKADSFIADSSFVEAAENFLRLASEYRETNFELYSGFTEQAADAFIKAGQFQTAIDLFVNLADDFETAEEAYYLYNRSWTVADSLLEDSDQAIRLKNDFIELHSSHILAFDVRVDLIEAIEDNPQTKYQAAEKWIEIHNEAAEGKIDTGDYAPQEFFYIALGLLADTLAYSYDEDYYVSRMLEFEKLYPEDERSDGLLILVYLSYRDRGMEEEANDLARYIFEKDPESTFYYDVALGELEKIYEEIERLYSEEDVEKTYAKIEEFERVHQRYEAEGVELDFDEIYERFEQVKFYYAELQRYESFIPEIQREIAQVKENFLDRTPAQLFRVNRHTEFEEHIDPRIQQLVRTAQENDTELQRISVRLSEFDEEIFESIGKSVPEEMYSQILYLIGNIYEHASFVLETQLNRYLQISDETQELLTAARDFPEHEAEYLGYYEMYAGAINNLITTYQQGFRQRSVTYYTELWNIGQADEDYTDEYIEAAVAKLSEWGELREELAVRSNTDWQGVMSELDFDRIPSSDWTSVTIYPDFIAREELFGMETSTASTIWMDGLVNIPVTIDENFVDDEANQEEEIEEVDTNQEQQPVENEKTGYFRKTINIDGTVVGAVMRYASPSISTIYINGEEVGSKLSIFYDEDFDETVAEALELESSVFKDGDNTIVIKIETIGDKPGLLYDLSLTVSK